MIIIAILCFIVTVFLFLIKIYKIQKRVSILEDDIKFLLEENDMIRDSIELLEKKLDVPYA